MATPIDREALWDKLEDALWYDNYDRDMAEKIVLDMPAADVAPVVHGKWKIMHVGRTIKCSNCGIIFDRFVNGAQLPEYCFCGAKMDGGEKANE